MPWNEPKSISVCDGCGSVQEFIPKYLPDGAMAFYEPQHYKWKVF